MATYSLHATLRHHGVTSRTVKEQLAVGTSAIGGRRTCEIATQAPSDIALAVAMVPVLGYSPAT